jgi:PST family polysaccharide transporter
MEGGRRESGLEIRRQPVRQQSFLRGAVILGVASFLSRLLGTVYKIPFENMTGSVGFYIYNQVYPLYTILLVLSTAGFPTAISKLVSERLVHGDLAGARRVYRVSTVILTLTGGFFFLWMFFGAPLIASWMGGGEELVLPIRSVSFALLLVPGMAALRGYFQGFQNMMPTAVSQVIEQLVRVSFILLVTFLAMHLIMPPERAVVLAASGAVMGAFVGAIAAYGYLLGYKRRVEPVAFPRPDGRRRGSRESFGRVARQILSTALPIALASLVLPLFNLVDAFTIKTILNWIWCDGAVNCQAAAYWKGVYDRGPTLVQFAAFFATAIALSIVPAVAESKERRLLRQTASRAELAIKLTLWLGIPATIGLAVIAEPVNVMLFRNEEGTLAVRIAAFTVMFSTLSMTCTGILQGVGHMLLPARILLMAVVLKVVANLILVPLWQINGASLATVIAYALAASLNQREVRRRVHITWDRPVLLGKPLLAALLMGALLWGMTQMMDGWLNEHLSPRWAAAWLSLLCVAVGTPVYGLLLLKSGAVRSQDLMHVPRLRKWVPHLVRWHLLKD